MQNNNIRPFTSSRVVEFDLQLLARSDCVALNRPTSVQFARLGAQIDETRLDVGQTRFGRVV